MLGQPRKPFKARRGLLARGRTSKPSSTTEPDLEQPKHDGAGEPEHDGAGEPEHDGAGEPEHE